MSKAPRFIYIPVEEAIIDKEYNGYKDSLTPNAIHFCSLVYKGNGTGWIFGDPNHVATNITELNRPLSFFEEAEWYRSHFKLNDENKLNLEGLFHDMYDIGDATHEMWNGWISTDFYEMVASLEAEDSRLIGIAPAPYDWNIGGECVAFVAESVDGECRFWSHGGLDWVKDMREQMQEVYDEINSNS